MFTAIYCIWFTIAFLNFFIKLKSMVLFLILLFEILVWAFNSLPNGEYSNHFIVAAFSSKFFSSKTYLPVKNSYLLTFPDDKAES